MRVEGSGFGFRISGLGFRVQGLGCGVCTRHLLGRGRERFHFHVRPIPALPSHDVELEIQLIRKVSTHV